ncbi:hypothetical protein NEDG_01469 [Nematocida displodere]|uniref:Mon2/Sec7/BIG1-like dimerisation and cyclophilin-binding domain-containing protein n=1 Tax=Nematocida displodere TaxID=1805483 RepID=A0A177EFM1_9MICR|nr:hypothetical protein NEDG_01469 [Nematocida displodere]
MQAEIVETLEALTKEKLPKQSALKEEAKTALLTVKEYQGSDKDFPAFAKENKAIIQPLVTAIQELQLKHKPFLLCFAALHRIITRGAVHAEFVKPILVEFEKSIETYPEVRIRVLQMLLPFVQDPLLVRGEDLLYLFKIGILLVETSRNQSVNTSRVIICHVVAHAFERPSTLKDESRQVAIQDCKNILSIAVDSAQRNNVFGLDLLTACIVDGEQGFREKEILMMLGDIIEFLLSKLECTQLPIISRVLNMLHCIAENIQRDSAQLIWILVSVSKAGMSEQSRVLREEFFYQVSYKTIWAAAQKDRSICQILFAVPAKATVGQLPPIKSLYTQQINRTAIPTETGYQVALRFLKLFSLPGEMEKEVYRQGCDQELLSVYIKHLSRAVREIEDLSTLEHACHAAQMLTEALGSAERVVSQLGLNECLNQILSLEYWLAEKNFGLFYGLASEATLRHMEKVTIWREFFDLAAKMQMQDPEQETWGQLTHNLKEFPKTDLKNALREACCSSTVRSTFYASLFLGLVYRVSELPEEFEQIIKKVFPIGETKDHPEETAERITSFFEVYFVCRLPEATHQIVLGQTKELANSLSAQSPDALVMKEILSSLSLGVRSAGESLQGSWTEIYHILAMAIKQPCLASTVFDIIQIITDRLLPFLPKECLLETARILSVCCTGIKDSNVSLFALGCVKELTEYILGSEHSTKSCLEVWHVSLCLLCTMAYDVRDDIRDSAIAQVFESIYLCRDKKLLEWQPLTEIFLRRLLGAAVYAKDKEIYSGEHDEGFAESPESDEQRSPEGVCPCGNIGACVLEGYETAAPENSKRSADSAKNLILAVSALMLEHFDEIKKVSGFSSLWALYGRILVRFSKDPEMASCVVSSLKHCLVSISIHKYWKRFFVTVSEICTAAKQKQTLSETLIQMLKLSHEKLGSTPTQGETDVFFAATTSILRHNQIGRHQGLTPLEFEAVCSLEEEGRACSSRMRVSTLLAWLRLTQDASSQFSSNFVVYCMSSLSHELQQAVFATELHREAVSILLSYHAMKKTLPSCWARARKTLQQLFVLEAGRDVQTQVIWASREILGLAPSDRIDATTSVQNKNKNILRAISENCNYVQVIKEEEKEMCEYLYFLETLSETAKMATLFEIYHLVVEIWSTSLLNSLSTLYLAATRVICSLIGQRKELAPLAMDWSRNLLHEYNAEIRLHKIEYSRFQREAVSYLLDRILEDQISTVDPAQLHHGLTLCVNAEDRAISRRAVKILQKALLQKSSQ